MGLPVTVVGRAREDAFVYSDVERAVRLTVARLSIEPLEYEGHRVEEVLLILPAGTTVEKGGTYRVSGEMGPRRVVTRSGKTTRLPIWELRVSVIDRMIQRR
ncbi:MAG: hypothetical protein QJR01_07525 [Kyrpidia sp.]|nr:hypothetical protein [Kyrpidia sp.]